VSTDEELIGGSVSDPQNGVRDPETHDTTRTRASSPPKVITITTRLQPKMPPQTFYNFLTRLMQSLSDADVLVSAGYEPTFDIRIKRRATTELQNKSGDRLPTKSSSASRGSELRFDLT
jgi:hypothetical protein